jgi:uncharacterized membrane protein (DUF2068 family)
MSNNPYRDPIQNPYRDLPQNPYQAPGEYQPVGKSASEAERIRRAHIAHEASIKSIGILYMLGAIILIPASIFLLVSPQKANDAEGMVVFGIGAMYLFLGVLQLATAVGLRKLAPWARWVAVVFSAIGLIGFPIGTLISAYILYLLLSQKGSMVFSENFKSIITATPHVKYKTSKVVWVLLILLLALFIVVIGFAVFGAGR